MILARIACSSSRSPTCRGWVFRRVRGADEALRWELPLITAWTGMRGGVSLAAALAIPLETDAGSPVASRDLIIFLTYAVILATLVLQGLSLPWLIRRLGLQDAGEDRGELKARVLAAKAAIRRIEELHDADVGAPGDGQRIGDGDRFLCPLLRTEYVLLSDQ